MILQDLLKNSMLTRSQGLYLNYTKPLIINSHRKPLVAGVTFWNTLPNDLKLCSQYLNKNSKLLLERYAR